MWACLSGGVSSEKYFSGWWTIEWRAWTNVNLWIKRSMTEGQDTIPNWHLCTCFACRWPRHLLVAGTQRLGRTRGGRWAMDSDGSGHQPPAGSGRGGGAQKWSGHRPAYCAKVRSKSAKNGYHIQPRHEMPTLPPPCTMPHRVTFSSKLR